MKDALTYHTRFTPDEFNTQYNLRAGRPDYEETVIPSWERGSAQARESLSCTLDVVYGEGPKQKLDVFYCGDETAPVLVYFHGGYWQRGDKSIYSFLALPFVEAGVNVVVVGYDLCPAVSITRITEQARESLLYTWSHATELRINRHRITVMGHSAGGHITQMMMATDWSNLAEGLPADLIKAGIPVSPLSYLEPVRLTQALNAGIRMDAKEAHGQSPMTNHPPVTNAPQLVVVGGAETDEFHRQARMYVDEYGDSERSIGLYIVPDVDHFDELNVLADTNSPLFNKTCQMLGLSVQTGEAN